MFIKDKKFKKVNLYKDSILRKDIYSNEKVSKYSCCPYCNGSHFIKFGKYCGIQRYKCKSCSKTFSNSTNSLWKYLKHSPEKWIKFLELLIEEKTIKECSQVLNISMVTAFNWRHKVLHGIEKLYKPKQFKDLIFMEMNYRRISYKGNKNKHYEFKSKFNKRYNIAPRDVYTVISYDINDEIIINNIGIFHKYNIKENKKMIKKFEDNIYNYCDLKSYIHIKPVLAKTIYNHVVKHDKKVSYKIRKMYNFNPNNIYRMDNIECSAKESNISVKLNKWLGKFRGVATRYLNHYCNLFALEFVNKDFNYMQVFKDLSSLNSYMYMSNQDMIMTHIENY